MKTVLNTRIVFIFSGISLLLFFFSLQTFAQTPGLLVRPPGGAGVTPINPNGDGFTSPTTAGFVTSDVGAGFSEIPYKTIPPFTLEPVGDLIRGPGGSFSDLVRTSVDESGLYIFNDGTNLLFRMRVGSLVSGSKGYSVLIDTDQKFGASGPGADPNYQPATTGNNGNPGFELEVVLETNFRVAVYNVDGASTPTLLTSFGINTNSQISVALSSVSGTPDYFYDFYVPISALTGVTATTPLRLAATTVMSPQAAIGGPKSDIYGVNDSGKDYMKDWETVINGQPTFTPTDVTSGGSGISASCTAAPTLNSPIAAGTVTVSGTWTRADAGKPSTATITLYQNSIAAGTTTVSTGATWTIPGVVAAANDVFYAKAQASGESACLQSNSVIVSGCAATSVVAVAITCATNRGFDGTVTPAGAVVRIYTVATTGYTLFADETTTTYKVIRPGGATPTRWYYDGPVVNSSNPCTGGSVDVAAASYAFTIQEAGKCESDYFYYCNGLASTTAAPTLSPIYSGSGIASGTAVANTTVRLFINGVLKATTTANGSGIYSFSSLIFNAGDIVDVYAQSTGQCVSSKATQTVACFVSPPNINANGSNQVAIGSTIAGTSFIPGATVTVYNGATNVSLGTATVQADGSWTSSITAAVSLTYYARQATACGTSAASATISTLAATSSARCGSITTSPLTEIVPSVGGTLSGVALAGTVVNLYLDGYIIGTTTTATNAWGPITVNSSFSNTLYAGGVLSIGIVETSKLEVLCPASSVTISCVAPTTPSVSPATVIITNANGQTTFTVSSSQSGVLYTLEDLAGIDKSVSVFGNGGSITLTSYAFLTPGTFNLQVTALKLSGSSCATSAAAVSITVNDNDADGVADVADIDDDNDGVLDSNETATFNATGDADGDGILNYRDTSPGGGLPSTDANSDGIIDAYDTDKDGIINQFDLDSDNDGIPDIIENGGTDANNDGKVDGTTDLDADGLRDAVDANTSGAAGSNGLAVLDLDKDGIPNYKDLDADGDGILDTREAGLPDANNDGIADGTSGADGWSDTIDGLASLNLPNSDGAGPADYLDIDADDDGLTDNVEGQSTAGYQLPSGNDADGDGIDDIYDNNDAAFAGNANNGITPYNHDGTDNPDYTDTDSDNDTVNDLKEGTGDVNATLTNTADTDGDGLIDQFDIFNLNTETTNLENNVTIAGMGNGGSPTGPVSAGSNVLANQTPGGAPNRDWRNSVFVLPVTFIDVRLTVAGSNYIVSWTVADELNVKEYIVERSFDGVNFIAAGTVVYRNNGGGQQTYSFNDVSSLGNNGAVYYRIRQVDIDGRFMISKVVLYKEGNKKTGLRVFGNPVSTNEVILNISAERSGIAEIRLLDMKGRVLASQKNNIGNGNTTIKLSVKSGYLASGAYFIKAVIDGQSFTEKITVNR
jgi:hypothetical protein